MAKVRVSELAKKMGISAKDLLFKLQSLGVQVEDSSEAIDHDIIVAILTGKKLPSRPRNVIMRDEKPQQEEEKRKTLVRPPRPIIKPTRPARQQVEAAPPAAPEGPIIPEFVQAAEAEASQPPVEEPVRPRRAPAKPKSAPAGQPEKAAATATEERPKRERARPTGPTGPRAGALSTPRPNYQGAPRVARPAAAETPSAARPEGRPVSRVIQPVAPPPPGTRRKRGPGGEEEDRLEKKKTTGKRGRRSTPIDREGEELLTKGPFSATAVLDEETGEPTVGAAPAARDEEEPVRRAPSSRRDTRKQAAPVSAKVLEFEKPQGTVTLSEGVTVKELADKLGIKANDLMKHLMMKKGLMLSINAPLGADLAMEIAGELGIEAELVSFEEALEIESLERMAAVDESTGERGGVVRAPVITVMGHVDHGKTSLLDAIRESNVADREAGGITQHIGAYEVVKRGQKIVFLDTPGHEAFTLMRARGAKVTDIVVLVVAADDGVMPQTKEAIAHARAAGVPMIVAINKIDKPNANPEKVRRELSDNGVLVEQWGGEVVSVEVSAKQQTGLDDLLEMILLTAEMRDLKAAPDMPARGVILEARKEAGRGTVGTVLVQDGSLHIGDTFFCGISMGRVRAMTNDRAERVREVGPSTPVSVTGFDEVPNAGDSFLVVDEGAQARLISEMRQQKARDQRTRKTEKMSLDQLFEKMQQGEVKELNLIIKADVQGSVEVLIDSLGKLSGEQVKVKIIHASVGAISTNDVLLASASNAIIIGFNVRPERNAADLADKEGVDVRLHTVIYHLTEEIQQAMTGLLEPTFEEVFQGRADVRDTFKVPKIGTIAGCYVSEGVIPRSSNVRLLRDNRVIYEGKIGSLRHFKNDVSEVRTGFECGIGIERFQDVKVGDVIEAFKIEERAGVMRG